MGLRPLYESPETLAAERSVMEIVGVLWDVQYQKLPRRYCIDFALLRDGRVCAWLEVKCRDVSRFQYKTFFISVEKIQNGLLRAAMTRKPFYLIVRWEEGDFWLQVNEEHLSRGVLTVGGRRDRGDPEDIEIMLHFNRDEFTPMDVRNIA